MNESEQGVVERSYDFSRELDSFVPQRVFDAHVEIWDSQATIADGELPVLKIAFHNPCEEIHNH